MTLIRKAEKADMSEILRIYACARAFMRKSGNPTQWGEQYPPIETIEKDMAEGDLYIGMGEDGKAHMVFAFLSKPEPLYENAPQANFRCTDYRAIHRVASDGMVKKAASACFEFCGKRAKSLRIDTHEDNSVMQKQLENNGFERCGIVHAEDGSPRIAYEKEC